MPGFSLDALKRYVLGQPEPADIELPQEGKKRDPRLPQPSAIRQGFDIMRDTMKKPEKK